MTGIELIAAERKRQIEEEGWTAKHDNEHDQDDLAIAGACYALPDTIREIIVGGIRCRRALIWELWPWDSKWFNPMPKNRIRELAKSGALIAAEIDRLQRLEVDKK
jgi:hypothetical protein